MANCGRVEKGAWPPGISPVGRWCRGGGHSLAPLQLSLLLAAGSVALPLQLMAHLSVSCQGTELQNTVREENPEGCKRSHLLSTGVLGSLQPPVLQRTNGLNCFRIP